MQKSDDFECIILGGGIVGAACFTELCKSGKKAVLLESRRIAMGATGWSGAVVRATHMDEQSTIQASFGQQRYLELADHSDGAVPFVKSGYLHFATEEKLIRAHEQLTELDIRAEILGRKQLQERFPQLDIKADHAIYEPDSGYMDPHLTTQNYMRLGIEHGGTYREGVEVTSLITTAGRVTGVETTMGSMKADTVVIALGAGAVSFMAQNNLCPELLHSRLIQVTLYTHQERLTGAPCFIDDETGTNGRYCPRTRGLFVGLPTGLTRGANIQSEPLRLPHAIDTRVAGIHRFGWLEGAKPSGGLCHTDAYSDKGEGLIGPCPDGPNGLFLATGFCGGGFKMAPYAAQAITSLISQKRQAA